MGGACGTQSQPSFDKQEAMGAPSPILSPLEPSGSGIKVVKPKAVEKAIDTSGTIKASEESSAAM